MQRMYELGTMEAEKVFFTYDPTGRLRIADFQLKTE